MLTLILSSAAWLSPSLSGQTTFVYERGKMFNDVDAFRMEQAIDLKKQQTPVYYEKNIPGEQQTVSYKTNIPSYKQGIFFSRDSRSDDYQWPNNTNRLLTWVFTRLDDLAKEDYPGIPSNGAPSLLGDALLLELVDGQYMFAKAVAGENSISWFRVNRDGSLTVFLSTLGTDNLAPQAPVLLMEKGKTAYEAIHKAYIALTGNREISALQKRTDKDYFEAFKYLGWCSWEHYHYDIDETKMLNDLDGIEASGLPIRYVLIDDGHLANKNRQLTSFVPDRERFPNGWKNIISRKKEDKVKWMGLWYNFCGYWMGISPENDFPEKVKQSLYPYNGSLLPGQSRENIDTFYHYYIRTLKGYGFDFLKIDNQSFLLPLYMGNKEVIRQSKACNLALEDQTHNQQVVQKLKAAGVNMEQEIVTAPKEGLPLSGQTVVITGTLPDMSREEAAQLIQANGGKVTGSVSKKTTFLLAGENAGSKQTEAETLGIPILTLEELQTKLRQETDE